MEVKTKTILQGQLKSSKLILKKDLKKDLKILKLLKKLLKNKK